MDDAAIRKLLSDLFTFTCERRLGEVVDTERILAVVDAAFTEPRIAIFQRRFLIPLRDRLLERFGASHEPLAHWLPDDARTELRDHLNKPVRVPRWIVDEIVTSETVRDEVREMVEQVVNDTLKRGGGVAGWGARAAAGAARGLLGGLGDSLQRGLEDRMRDLIATVVANAQKRIARRLLSKETARDLGRRRRRLFLKLLERTDAEAVEQLRALPMQLIDRLLAPVLAHNLARGAVRDAMRDEIDAVLRELAHQTIGELLEEYGLTDLARRTVMEKGEPIVRDFLAWRAGR